MSFRLPLQGMMGACCAALLLSTACAAVDAPAPASVPATRVRVPPPRIVIEPADVSVAPGASTTLTAETGGGEAILFSADWSIAEGAAGGSLGTPAPDPATPRRTSVVYTAPAQPGGPYHVVATIRGRPEVRAVATVTVSR
ncbi:MAG TPA: hypothetical protein VJ743_02675 [Albitalea sp.]|nr:hypothetical protein [Albitalea sp.]